MKMVENFYALEGLDATGKSTTRDILGKIGFNSLRTPPENFPFPREKYDSLDLRIRFVFFI